MLNWNPPVLGFGDDYLTEVRWKDRTLIAGGILGLVDPAQMAAERTQREAEQARKEELRSQGVMLLDDFRRDSGLI